MSMVLTRGDIVCGLEVKAMVERVRKSGRRDDIG